MELNMPRPIVLDHVESMPLDTCFTHRCTNKATQIAVTQRSDNEPGFSLMCDTCKAGYIRNFTEEGLIFEPWILERAEELDKIVKEYNSK